MTTELRTKLLEWLESGNDVEKRHARNRLAMADAESDESPPTPEDLALRSYVARHGGCCGGPSKES